MFISYMSVIIILGSILLNHLISIFPFYENTFLENSGIKTFFYWRQVILNFCSITKSFFGHPLAELQQNDAL